MALRAGGAIRLHRFLVRFDQRLVNVFEHLRTALARVDLRDGLDGAHPAGRFRRHIHRVLVILLDARDGLAQRAVQGGIVRKILAHAFADAHELALDDAFLRFAAGREQHLAIAGSELRFTAPDGVRGYAQSARERDSRDVNRLMRGVAREVEHRNCQDDPEQRGNGRPRSNSEKNPHTGNPAVIGKIR